MTITAVVSVLFFNTSYGQPKSAQRELAELLDLLGMDSSGNSNYGQAVHIDDVKACTVLYKTEMAKHGFKEKVEAVNLQILESKKITWSENFRGFELIAFLKMAAARRGEHNTRIKIVFGMYTEDYLKKYASHLDDAEREDRKNRIAVFLVTCDWNEKTKNYEFAKEEDEDDEYAFDFGGLQP